MPTVHLKGRWGEKEKVLETGDNCRGLGGNKLSALENRRRFGLAYVVMIEEWHFSLVSHNASPLSQSVVFPPKLFQRCRTVDGWIQAICTEDLTHQIPLEN